MASVGGFFSALGKGARAVGRGAMKGVLGFDDRDVRNRFGKKKEDHEEPDGDEMNEDYSGYSRGIANLEKPAVESDGMLEEFEMEDAPEIGMTGQESLIGLEMPSLPGFKGKGGAKGGKSASGMALRIEPPKVTPTAYETVSGGAKPELQIPGMRNMRGTIAQDVDSMEGFVGATPTSMQRDYVGNTTFEGIPMEDALSEAEGYREGVKDYAIGAATGPALKAAGMTMRAIPGLTRGAKGKAGKALDWYMNANTKAPYMEPGGPPTRMYGGRGGALPGGMDIKGGYMGPTGAPVPKGPMGAPPAGPGKSAIDKRLSDYLRGNAEGGKYFEPGGGPGTQYAQELFPGGGPAPAGLYPRGLRGNPMPGRGGVEGPMTPLPPGMRETNMEVLYSPVTKSLKRIAR